LNEIYAKHTGKDLKAIEKALDRDTFMTANDAMDFGIIDTVVESREAISAEGEEKKS
jgi:ATP-dependent Clp protease protease subunit